MKRNNINKPITEKKKLKNPNARKSFPRNLKRESKIGGDYVGRKQREHRNSKRTESRDSRVEDLLASTHDGN